MSTQRPESGFTLIEVLIVVAIVGIVVTLAVPSYNSFIRKSSRASAERTLLELATAQEKIYLNSNAYTTSLTNAYTGLSSGGLGSLEHTPDQRYSLTLTASTDSFTVTAVPMIASGQAGDGTLTVNSLGSRLWGTASW